MGVVAPFLLGWGVSAWLLPEHSIYLHVFIGATLCATSVGITARVLKDLGRSQSNEARVILGAAVIDDVLGLVILSAVTGLIVAADRGSAFTLGTDLAGRSARRSSSSPARSRSGVAVSPEALRARRRGCRRRGVLLATGLAFCFLLSWLANVIELAPIVGAFAAGLILEPVHYRRLRRPRRARLGGADPPDRVVPGAGLLRPDGDAHRSEVVRAARRPRPGRAP